MIKTFLNGGGIFPHDDVNDVNGRSGGGAWARRQCDQMLE